MVLIYKVILIKLFLSHCHWSQSFASAAGRKRIQASDKRSWNWWGLDCRSRGFGLSLWRWNPGRAADGHSQKFI